MSGRRLLLAATASALLGVGACSTSLESCDPNKVDEVFTSAACDSYFQQRIAKLEARIAHVEAEASLQVAAAASATAAGDEVKLEIEQYLSDIAALQSSIDRMRVEMGGLSRANEEQTRLAAAMRNQIDQANAALVVARANAGPTGADIRKLEKTVEAQRAAYQALLDIYKTPI